MNSSKKICDSCGNCSAYSVDTNRSGWTFKCIPCYLRYYRKKNKNAIIHGVEDQDLYAKYIEDDKLNMKLEKQNKIS